MIYQNSKILTTSFTSDGTSIYIEEYDTSDGWHVRKWSDGYVEMVGVFEHTLKASDWTPWGNMYSVGSKIPIYSYPIALASIYSEVLSVNYPDGKAAAITQGTRESLNKTKLYGLIRGIPDDGDRKLVLNYFVTGRWKSDGSTKFAPATISAIPESISVKASSAKTIDEI